MVEIMKKKYNQDLFLNVWCDPLGYFAKDELNPRVRCAFGNVLKSDPCIWALHK